MRRNLRSTLVACALALAISPSSGHAQQPWTLSYEGALTDLGGTQLPDGPYSLTFRFYADSIGGSAMYTDVHPIVSVLQGHFAVTIGSNTELPTWTDAVWFSVQVNSDPELSPRTLVTAAPHALGLRFPQVISGHESGPVLKITNTGTGAAVEALSRVLLGSSTEDGALEVHRAGYAQPVIEARRSFTDGGEIYGVSPYGTVSFTMEPDGSGEGGRLLLNRDNGMVGFSVEGNWAGTEVPIVGIHGSARSVIFDMTTSGDASVQLPPSSIEALELHDETGVALNYESLLSVTSLTSTSVMTASITAPAAGYVVAMATMRADMDVSGGTPTNEVRVGLNNSATPPGNLLTATNGAAWRIPITVQKIFPVTAGGVSIRLFAGRDVNTSAVTLNNVRLTLLYVPTFVGGVTGQQAAFEAAGQPDHMKHDLAQIEATRTMLIRQLEESDRAAERSE